MNAKTQLNKSLAGRVRPGVDPLVPRAQGLYDPTKEHASCGVGFVADMKNRKSHDILEKGLQILANLDHRGAVGADPALGDGCGVLTQIPHGFFAPECAKLGFSLPEPGFYAIGQFFMPRHAAARRQVASPQWFARTRHRHRSRRGEPTRDNGPAIPFLAVARSSQDTGPIRVQITIPLMRLGRDSTFSNTIIRHRSRRGLSPDESGSSELRAGGPFGQA